MKNLLLYLIVAMIIMVIAILLGITSYSKRIMTMTTAKLGHVETSVNGSGFFSIDWGDGSEIKSNRQSRSENL